MTRPVRRASDIHLAALDIRRAGELLMAPCGCNGKDHTLAEHLWQSTRDMEPGIRASIAELRVAGVLAEEGDTDADPTVSISDRYRTLVQDLHTAALLLTDFVAAHRPDRVIELPATMSDDEWCRSHLRLGLCEPRFRGDRCRFCNDFALVYLQDPPLLLLQMRRQGQRITQTDITQAVQAERAARKAQRRKGKGKARKAG